jgi:hypothetical protein
VTTARAKVWSARVGGCDRWLTVHGWSRVGVTDKTLQSLHRRRGTTRAVHEPMKKLIPFTVLAAMLCSAGVASADRHRGRDHDGDRGRRGTIVVRDRGHDHRTVRDVRVQRQVRYRPRLEHRTVFVSNGAFRFDGGVVRRWRAPVIRHRYFDVRVQPAPVVEYYDAMPGYAWIAGQWQWTGAEWQWMPGHYELTADYGYQQGYGYPPSPY